MTQMISLIKITEIDLIPLLFIIHTCVKYKKKNAISAIIDPLYLFIISQEFIANHHSNMMQGQHSQHSGSVKVLNGCERIEN